ncbi:hypothetical protein JOM56_015179 [Amanita muscaria]
MLPAATTNSKFQAKFKPIIAATQAERELELLHDISSLGFRERSIDQELCTAPIFTRDAYIAIGQGKTVQQYGVLGSMIEIGSKDEKETPPDPRLYLNTNAPLSAVICGVQGSGKSHTVSVMLENMLVPNCARIGTLAQPLAGLVLHFGEGALPSEAASIGIRNEVGHIQTPEIHVYVPKSSLKGRKQAYARVGPEIKVMPLLFEEYELDAEAFLKMMAVESLESAPLYMQAVMAILRDLGEDFTLAKFQSELKKRRKTFNPAQLAHLEQRMALLTSFLATVPQQKRFSAGRLTIIDLSDPFVDSNSACNIFEVVVRSFVRAEVNTGKVLLVDEAHKYLSSSADGSTGLTKSLLTLIREQRHFAMRVLVSTQEPTVIPPVILDLCSVMVLHRFSSPRWWNHVVQHITAEIPSDVGFDKVSGLQTGEAIVLSPSGLTMVDNGQTLGRFGRRYIVMKTRKRVTRDSGTSVLVV